MTGSSWFPSFRGSRVGVETKQDVIGGGASVSVAMDFECLADKVADLQAKLITASVLDGELRTSLQLEQDANATLRLQLGKVNDSNKALHAQVRLAILMITICRIPG
jgi:hypothetical protein